MSELVHQGRIVRASITTSASANDVWAAWANPENLAQWFPNHAEGSAEVGASMKWKFDRFDMEMTYRVLVSEPGKRLVLGPDEGAAPFLLEVAIEESAGESTVRVINSGFSDDSDTDEEIAGIDSGWQMALATMKFYVENHLGQARKCFFAVREADFEYEELIQFYRDSFKLAQWLTNDGGLVNGKPVNLVLRDGRSITGTVLAETPREIAISWDEIDGLVELKAFSLGEGRRAVCVHGCGWGLSAEEARVIEASMEGALDRLVAALAA